MDCKTYFECEGCLMDAPPSHIQYSNTFSHQFYHLLDRDLCCMFNKVQQFTRWFLFVLLDVHNFMRAVVMNENQNSAGLIIMFLFVFFSFAQHCKTDLICEKISSTTQYYSYSQYFLFNYTDLIAFVHKK